MLIGLQDALFLSGAHFWCVVVHGFVWLGLVGPRFVRRGSNVAHVHEVHDVFMYRDSSVAPLLDLRRAIKGCHGCVGLHDSKWGLFGSVCKAHCPVEGNFQDWSCPSFPLWMTFGFGEFRRVAGALHCRLTGCVHKVVVLRRDEAIRGWRNWSREDPLVHPYQWLRPDMVPPAQFLQCKPHLTHGGSGVLADPVKIDGEF